MNEAGTLTQAVADVGLYRAQLMKFARIRLRNPAQAEDAVQDAFLAALESMHGYSGDASMGTWLTGILKHKIVDCVRRSAREPTAIEDADAFASDAGCPEDALVRRGLLGRLDRCLSELPAKAAQVFLLRDVLGMSTAEASGELAISTDYCAVLLHRARRALRSRLTAQGFGSAA